MHITLLTSVLYKILNKTSKNKKLNLVLIILFLTLYMFLTNYTPSVLRASFLFILINIKKISKFKLENIHILLLIFFTLLIYNPYYIYNLGFLFSFIISFSLIKYNHLINKYKNYFTKIFITSLISFIFSIPIIIININQINLITPLVNCLFVPLVSLLVFPISLLTFIFPFLNSILKILINILEFLATFLNKFSIPIILSSGNILTILFYFIIIFLIFRNFKRKKLILLIIIIFIHNNSHYFIKYPVMTLIDVGQGDSILIELPHNKGNILIDTGGNYNKELGKTTLIPYFKSVGIKKIDYLIITHGDYDHIGSALYLINNFKIKNIYLNSGKNNKEEIKIINSSKEKNIKINFINKYELKIDKYKFNFINDKDINNENEDSLITYTTLNNKNILLMGDAGKISEKYLLDAYNFDKVDILKLGHHGSRNSSSIEFLNKINPNNIFISVGLNNRFGHPHKETLERIKNIKTYMTSINGMIKIILKDNIEIYTCN